MNICLYTNITSCSYTNFVNVRIQTPSFVYKQPHLFVYKQLCLLTKTYLISGTHYFLFVYVQWYCLYTWFFTSLQSVSIRRKLFVYEQCVFVYEPICVYTNICLVCMQKRKGLYANNVVCVQTLEIVCIQTWMFCVQTSKCLYTNIVDL